MKLDAWMGSVPGATVLVLVRLGMAAVFIVYAIPKIQAPDLFAGMVLNYQILPPWGVNTLALVLPWVELTAGVCLAAGIWSRASALLMAGMMLVFIAAYAAARARGLDIACGCHEVGPDAKPSSAAWVVLRDLGLLAGAVLLARYDGGPRPLDLVRRLAGRSPSPAR